MLQGLLPHLKHVSYALARYHLHVPPPQQQPGQPPQPAAPAGPGGLQEGEVRLMAR